jgi:hypothetical protein
MPSSRAGSRCLAGVALIATLVAVAAPAHAQLAPSPAPQSVVPSPKTPPGFGMAAIGATIFVGTYLASSLTATTGFTADDGTSSDRGDLWIPVVGPFMQLGSTHSGGLDVLLVLDALAQAAGLTMFVYDVATPPPPDGPATPAARAPAASLRSLPVPGGSGATLIMSF